MKTVISASLTPPPTEVWELYHEHSKLRRRDRGCLLRITAFFASPYLLGLASQPFRIYPTAPRVVLSSTGGEEGAVERLIARRRSTRQWSKKAVSLSELARMLRSMSGITGVSVSSGVSQFLRAAPSGGALYPVETYLGLFNVAGTTEGLYHYNPREHVLEQLHSAPGLQERLAGATVYPEVVSPCAILVMLTGVFERTILKYGERGYRFVLLEVGHIAQNLCLLAEEMGLGAVCLGGFYDREVETVLGIDGTDESILYLVAVGHKAVTEDGNE